MTDEIEPRCVHCGDLWIDHYPLGLRMVCYNKDPHRIAIISGTYWQPPTPPFEELADATQDAQEKEAQRNTITGPMPNINKIRASRK